MLDAYIFGVPAGLPPPGRDLDAVEADLALARGKLLHARVPAASTRRDDVAAILDDAQVAAGPDAHGVLRQVDEARAGLPG